MSGSYALFLTDLDADGFLAEDVLDLYHGRGAFEAVLADEDAEDFNHSTMMSDRGTQQAMYLYKMEVCILFLPSFSFVQTHCPDSREGSEDIP